MCRLYEKFASYFSSYKWSYYWAYPTGRQEEEARQNACAWQTWQGYYLRVMSWSSLDINAFWSFTKRSVQRRVDFGGRVFQTKLLSRLSHKVCGLPSSPVLLRKFTINAYELDYETVLGHESWPSSPCNHLMANKRRDSVPETLCSSIQPRPSLTLTLSRHVSEPILSFYRALPRCLRPSVPKCNPTKHAKGFWVPGDTRPEPAVTSERFKTIRQTVN